MCDTKVPADDDKTEAKASAKPSVASSGNDQTSESSQAEPPQSVRKAPAETAQKQPEPIKLDVHSRHPGKLFLDWLRAELEAGRLTVNQNDSLVFVVKEGVLLVVPGLFQRYQGLGWEKTRKDFLRLAIHAHAERNQRYFQCWFKDRPSVRFQALLIPAAQFLFTDVPPPASGIVARFEKSTDQ